MQLSSNMASTSWLAAQINADTPNVVVLDASIFLDITDQITRQRAFVSGIWRFESGGHIPGARFADLFAEFSDAEATLPFTRPTRPQFEEAASRVGVSPDSHVVIYDDLAGQWASRLWWVFRTFGHKRVSVLDGGMQKWRRERRAVEREARPFKLAAYSVVGERPIVAKTDDVRAIVAGERPGTLLCLLERTDFLDGGNARPRPGHIPGSLNLPFSRLINPDDNTLRDRDALRAAFSEVARLDGGLIVTYCGGGIASTVGALALAELGYTNTLEYDGSLMDWSMDPSLPLITGDRDA